MIRRLYDWLMQLAGGPRALPALGAVSFAESSFFPIPPDVMLIPIILARPDRAWSIALVCTIASVVGGIFGYAIGYFLFETIGGWIIQVYGYQGQAESFRAAYAEWGLWIILIKGLTPIPYKLVTIVSGAAAFNFPLFVAASIVTRGARFFLVAALLRVYGAPVREFVEKRLTLVTTLFIAIVIGGFVIVRYIV